MSKGSTQRPTDLKAFGDNYDAIFRKKVAPGSRKADYKCKDCGHVQSVTEVVAENGGVYVGSGANWCDKCGDGLPERVEPSNPSQSAFDDIEEMLKHPLEQPQTEPATQQPMPIAGWKAKVRGTNQELPVVGVYDDTIFVHVEQPAGEPLSREQVTAMLCESGFAAASQPEQAAFISGIRHCEAAHGITGEAK